MKRFNIIVTCGRFMEFNALRELESIFYLLGEEDARFRKSGVSGVLIGRIKMDPHVAVARIRELIQERPWDFRFTKRYIPIDKVVKTGLEEIREAALALAKTIPEDATYRITVEKRYTDLHSRDIIDAIAPSIDRRVQLDDPDYILLIEVLGEYTGVSLIKPDEIVSVEKELLPE
jgi:tRNA acetyltransferase TAN1